MGENGKMEKKVKMVKDSEMMEGDVMVKCGRCYM